MFSLSTRANLVTCICLPVFELDGLKSGPVNLGDIPGHGGNLASTSCSGVHGDDWLSVASPAIEERIARYSAGEIRFNLLAIVKNRMRAWDKLRGLQYRPQAVISQEFPQRPSRQLVYLLAVPEAAPETHTRVCLITITAIYISSCSLPYQTLWFSAV
ncbi:conserved unknown protein [Ectocarpus siliculosus]|uniref:ubiquitinyl hydrolase 1 n=1 Tax=Ectocarpus siliculosus TaxID=2880 RepID=D7G5X3_ECTSI|nr:conserved unknown protein [Ectocarpus siliculosus]|eukprot:CBJ27411.1 conserved unknown protein [Ectocarpus siliculosus]